MLDKKVIHAPLELARTKEAADVTLIEAIQRIREFSHCRNLPLQDSRALRLLETLYYVDEVFGFFADEAYPEKEPFESARIKPSRELMAISTVVTSLENEIRNSAPVSPGLILDRITKCEEIQGFILKLAIGFVLFVSVVMLSKNGF